jgi:hypothetical protein
VEDFGGLLDGEAAEETHLDDANFARIELGEGVERIIKGNQFD